MGLFTNSPSSFNGYTLFAQNASNNTYLIDNCGNEVHTWTSGTTPGLSVYLLENGNLLRTARLTSSFNAGGSGGGIRILDWNSNLVWSYDYSSTAYHQHHDVEYLPNGNILVLAWEAKTIAECTQAGRNTGIIPNGGLWPEHIVELEPVGTNSVNIVWEWHMWDHLIQDFDATKDNYGVVADHPELVDINYNTNSNSPDAFHANGIDYNAELDQIVISVRAYSEFWVIDHSTTTAEAASHTGGNSGKGGDILYRWGNPRTYGRGTLADQQLFSQHDARWIDKGYPNEGKIMVYNNGGGRPGGNYSSVDIIDTNIDNNGNYPVPTTTAFEPPVAFWTFEGNQELYSSNISGAHPLPNGNALMCVGQPGRFIEMTFDKEIVWDYICPIRNTGPLTQGGSTNGNNTFRTTRYAPDYLGLAGRDLTPSGPLELNPLPSDCIIHDTINVVINEIRSTGEIELKNLEAHDINIASFWLVNESNSVQIRNANFVCGDTILSPNEIIVIDNFLNVSSIDGEMALYANISFTSSKSIIDYVQWGNTGHTHAPVATVAGQWSNNTVLSFQAGESIEYVGFGEDENAWLVQTLTSICSENNSLSFICNSNDLNIPSVSQSLYHAKQSISSSANINLNNVTYKAGTTICLDAGFEVQIGTEFLGTIENCTNCFISNESLEK